MTNVDSWHTVEVANRKLVLVTNVRGTQKITRGYGPDDEITVDLVLYLDPETGLVVWDPFRYDEFIKENRLTPAENEEPEQEGWNW